MKRLILILILYSFNSAFSAITINSVSKTASTCLNNGTITVNATSNSQILYSIIKGPSTVSPQSSNKFEGLAPGTYMVKVENLLAETATESVVIITNYVIIDFKQIVNHGSCLGANDGRVIGNALSGTGTKPFTWKLKNNNSGQVKTQVGNDTFNSLPSGDYTLTVTDSCLNTTVHNFEVQSGVSGFININSSFVKMTCSSIEVSTSFQTKETTFPIRVKYEYGNTVIIKQPTPSGSNSIKDNVAITIPMTEKLKVTLYNACGDSISTYAPSYSGIRVCSEMTTCNSAKLTLDIYLQITQIPQLIYKTKNGTTTLTNVPISNNQVNFNVINVDETDLIDIMIITNCNDTIRIQRVLPVFRRLITKSHNNLNSKCNQRNYVFEFENCDKTKGSISYSFYDMTHKLLETKSGLGFDDITLRNYPSGTKYYIKIKNGCNKEYIDTFLWESEEGKPFFEVNKKLAENCLDSTIGIGVRFNRLKGEPKLISLTGPSVIRSSKLLYAYSDGTDYEQFYPSQTFIYYGLGVGKYSITLKDSCESSTVNFEIYPHEVSNYYYSYQPIKACEDNNQLLLKLYSKHSTNLTDREVNGFYSIYNLKTEKYLDDDENIAFKYRFSSSTNELSYNKTFRYLNEGKYLLKVKYRNDTFDENIDIERYVTKSVYCNEIQDTLIIPPYTRPNIKVILKIQCGTQTWVEFQPDTNFGIFPYKYEINKGQQLFPVQNDNVFPIYQMGNYQAKIWDTCGNANTMDFSVDTVKFNRIYINDSTCAGDSVIMAYQSSPYFTYKWLKPNGSVFVGDTLKINPLKVSDVGLYKITKYVNFRGCKDSFYIDYLLKKYRIEHKYDTIKDGDTFYLKSKPIIKEGSYREVIPMLPCDSFFIQHIHVIDTYLNYITKKELCIGDSFYYRGKYYSQPGVYIDTVDVFKYADSVFSLYLSSYPKVKLKVTKKANVTCNGQDNGVINIIASGENPPYTFLLNGIYSNTGGYFSNLPSGNYKVTFVTNQNCVQDTVINITQPDKLILNVFAESDPIEVCNTSRLVSNVRYINGGALPPLEYIWSPSDGLSCTDCPSPKFNGYQSQKYTLTLKDTNNCKLVASTKVNVFADNSFFVPQIFTPNGDQLNDKYRVYCNCVRTIDFSIYNRWGVKVYHTKALDEGWNGKYNDIESLAGVYSYIARVTFMNGEIKEKVGEFILAR
jgi:gliding motility-associated-like protein